MNEGVGMGRHDPIPFDSLTGLHVLVVDDEDDVRDLVSTVLQYAGALVTAVSSTQGDLDVLTRFTPDVLLSDLAMPGSDGYDLVRRVRALPSARGVRIPVVAMTAHGTPHGPDRTLAAGFNAHLRKPLDPWELCRVVGSLARRSGAASIGD